MKRLKELREETGGQTRMLWHNNYWDGPISGMMLWDGEMRWFQMFDETWEECLIPGDEWKEWVEYYREKYGKDPDEEDRIEHDRTRKYRVYVLPEEVKKAIIHNHELFRKYVGIHTDYDEKGCRYLGEGYLRPYSEHSKFYNSKKSNNLFVRWFPFLFKKQDIKMEYSWNLDSYEVVGEFSE